MSTWIDSTTAHPIPHQPAWQRRPRRRSLPYAFETRSPGEVRLDAARRAERESLRQLREFVLMDPAEPAILAAAILGPERRSEREAAAAELRLATQAVKLHRATLPGRPVPDATLNRFAAALRAVSTLDERDRRERVIITNARNAEYARKREAKRRRALAARRRKEQREQLGGELVASAWPWITPADRWPGVTSGLLF
jgi:hypothetical protein